MIASISIIASVIASIIRHRTLSRRRVCRPSVLCSFDHNSGLFFAPLSTIQAYDPWFNGYGLWFMVHVLKKCPFRGWVGEPLATSTFRPAFGLTPLPVAKTASRRPQGASRGSFCSHHFLKWFVGSIWDRLLMLTSLQLAPNIDKHPWKIDAKSHLCLAFVLNSIC